MSLDCLVEMLECDLRCAVRTPETLRDWSSPELLPERLMSMCDTVVKYLPPVKRDAYLCLIADVVYRADKQKGHHLPHEYYCKLMRRLAQLIAVRGEIEHGTDC